MHYVWILNKNDFSEIYLIQLSNYVQQLTVRVDIMVLVDRLHTNLKYLPLSHKFGNTVNLFDVIYCTTGLITLILWLLVLSLSCNSITYLSFTYDDISY